MVQNKLYYVFLAAARVGGILANDTFPQPMKGDYLLTGPLEPTNSAYAVAKISGIEMCWAYNPNPL